jgi:ribosome-interacting GTPase 1
LLSISASTGRNLERLKRVLHERLEIIQVYAKPPGRKPDLSEPFVLEIGSTVEELAAKVHQDFFDKLKSARVWGSASSAFPSRSRPHLGGALQSSTGQQVFKMLLSTTVLTILSCLV